MYRLMDLRKSQILWENNQRTQFPNAINCTNLTTLVFNRSNIFQKISGIPKKIQTLRDKTV